MPQAREIKRRIRSVTETRQITRAMKMVATAKLRRAQQRMFAMRPYADKLDSIIADVALDIFGDEHPLFGKREEKTVATVVIAGDKGLCGGFNSNIVRFATQHFNSMPDVTHKVYSIGKRATSALRKQKHEIVHSYTDVFDTLSYVLANEICQKLVDAYFANEIDAAYVVYNSFVSVIAQKPTAERILPIDFAAIAAKRKGELEKSKASLEEEAAQKEIRAIYELEPDPDTVMNRMVTRLIGTRVYRATLESYAAELGARMTAMDNATSNAEEMIDDLTQEYNRARQTAITGELLDIVGGAESLNG